MNFENIKQTVTEIFQDVMDREFLKIERETSPDDIEEWDSLATINIIVAIEKAFNIKFDLSEIRPFENIGEIFDLIEAKVA